MREVADEYSDAPRKAGGNEEQEHEPHDTATAARVLRRELGWVVADGHPVYGVLGVGEAGAGQLPIALDRLYLLPASEERVDLSI